VSLPTSWDTTGAPSAFDPSDWLAHCARTLGRAVPALPPLAIQSVVNAPDEDVHLELVERRSGAVRDDFTQAQHPFAVFSHEGTPVALATSAKGSSAAGGLDELVALGARRIVVLCVGGALSDAVAVGDVIAVTAALRDEGTSDHYAPPARWAHPAPALQAAVARAARAAGVTVHEGRVWTTHAHFRLALPRLRALRDEGCLLIDNEAASAFAVGAHRGVEVAVLAAAGLTFARERPEIPADALLAAGAAERWLDIALAALAGSPR